MKTVVVNAISIKEGGPLVVLRELVCKMIDMRPEWKWIIVVNSCIKNKFPLRPSLALRYFPSVDRSAWRVNLWYETGLPRLLNEFKADILFSLTNYLPRRSLPCNTLLLVQHAGHFSGIFNRLMQENSGFLAKLSWKLKKQWVKTSVKRANLVTVQTKALANNLKSVTGCDDAHVRVIPHGIGLVFRQPKSTQKPAAGVTWRIGYITKAGIQKNFAVLFDAAKILMDKRYDFKLVLTLTSEEFANYNFTTLNGEQGIADVIENHGEISPEEIKELYKSLHFFVFPSLCESFGFPMVEAMAHGLPLLIADTDSNQEVAGDAGITFPAEDPAVLARELEHLFNDANWYKQQAGASLARSNQFEWSVAAKNTLALLDEITAGK